MNVVCGDSYGVGRSLRMSIIRGNAHGIGSSLGGQCNSWECPWCWSFFRVSVIRGNAHGIGRSSERFVYCS